MNIELLCNEYRENKRMIEELTALNEELKNKIVAAMQGKDTLIVGLSDESKTACTGVDNRNICGYGSGYGVIPYFEGGVGVGCFWDILKRGGYTTRCNYGKHENYYTVSKESEV